MADTDGVPGDGDRKEVERRQAATARVLHKVLLEQGEEELDRPAQSLFWSGGAAGLAIHASISRGRIGIAAPKSTGIISSLIDSFVATRSNQTAYHLLDGEVATVENSLSPSA